MMKYSLFPLLILSGCATVHDFDRRAPDGRYSSAKSVPVLTQCITSRIAQRGRVQVERRENSNLITLRRENGYAVARITLRPTSAGSTVAIRQAISYSLAPSIQNCL
ncbi:MAG: hypothetical protein H0W74_07610 [Sphingosinicella sp.]|nr:hypothetical protein [Sphingosinicella sp.]